MSENTNTWQSPQAGCQLGDGEVHVWRTRRHWSPAAIARFRDLLSSEERAKADAFHFEADRHRAIVGRGLLRHLLGTPATAEYRAWREHFRASMFIRILCGLELCLGSHALDAARGTLPVAARWALMPAWHRVS